MQRKKDLVCAVHKRREPSPKNFSGISEEHFWRNSEELRGEKFRRIS